MLLKYLQGESPGTPGFDFIMGALNPGRFYGAVLMASDEQTGPGSQLYLILDECISPVYNSDEEHGLYRQEGMKEYVSGRSPRIIEVLIEHPEAFSIGSFKEMHFAGYGYQDYPKPIYIFSSYNPEIKNRLLYGDATYKDSGLEFPASLTDANRLKSYGLFPDSPYDHNSEQAASAMLSMSRKSFPNSWRGPPVFFFRNFYPRFK